jgi:hypothetical protein
MNIVENELVSRHANTNNGVKRKFVKGMPYVGTIMTDDLAFSIARNDPFPTIELNRSGPSRREN